MSAEFDFANDVKIDAMKLDREWIRQPSLYMKYAEALAKARAKMEKAKEEVDFVKADLDAVVRADLASRGEKVTEASVQAGIATHPDMRAALADLGVFRDEVGTLQAAVSALEHKKYALQNLVMLHGQKYFSALTVGEEGVPAAKALEEAPARRTEERMAARGPIRRRGQQGE